MPVIHRLHGVQRSARIQQLPLSIWQSKHLSLFISWIILSCQWFLVPHPTTLFNPVTSSPLFLSHFTISFLVLLYFFHTLTAPFRFSHLEDNLGPPKGLAVFIAIPVSDQSTESGGGYCRKLGYLTPGKSSLTQQFRTPILHFYVHRFYNDFFLSAFTIVAAEGFIICY